MGNRMSGQGMGSGDRYVADRGDVKKELADLRKEHGVDSASDVRRAHGSYKRDVREAQDTEQLGLHADGTPGQLAADYAALRTTLGFLGHQREKVADLVRRANGIADNMLDGHGPIAHAMRATFSERADYAAGALKMLIDYATELDSVIAALNRTAAAYEQADADAMQRLLASGGDHA